VGLSFQRFKAKEPALGCPNICEVPWTANPQHPHPPTLGQHKGQNCLACSGGKDVTSHVAQHICCRTFLNEVLPQCTKDCIATFADCVSSPDSWPFAPKGHSYFRSRACSWCIPVCRVTHIEDGSRVDKLSLFKVWADQEGTTKYDLSCRPSVIICTFPASAAQKMGVKPCWSLASIAAPCFSSASVAPISAR
jgi:hypothetical protein